MGGLKNHISPIIEPVKESSATLEKTINNLQETNINFNLVINPQVGDLIGTVDANTKFFMEIIGSYENYQPTIILENQVDLKKLLKILSKYGLRKISAICNEIPSDIPHLIDFIQEQDIRFLIIDENISSKRFLRELKKTGIDRITLSDPFNSQKRNIDYITKDYEFFSDEHLFYKEDGFFGFSDYSITGKRYSDSGFLPYAVAIHLTLFNESDELWIKHFVSNSNEDTTDVPGKFSEALNKLILFIDRLGIDSLACQAFRQLAEKEAYPGLGTIKKLSIMNHIEQVYNHLITSQE